MEFLLLEILRKNEKMKEFFLTSYNYLINLT